MFQFGIGGIFGRRVGGTVPISVSGPRRFGTVQDASVEMNAKLVELRGQLSYPDDVAPGDREIKGKATFAKIEVEAYNELYFADTISTGVKVMADSEAQNVPAGGVAGAAWVAGQAYAIGAVVTDGAKNQICVQAGNSENPGPPIWNEVVGGFTADGTVVWECLGVAGVTITVSSAANFLNDFGVRYADGSGDFVQVAAGLEVKGKYSVVETGAGKGIYTFAAADENAQVLISYLWNDATHGRTLSVGNRPLGYGPVFELYLMQPYQGNNGLHLWACRSSKMSAPMKRDGYMVSDFEFTGFANPGGQVFEWFEVTA